MKIGYFITARLKSSRLKQKIVLPLNGRNVLDHVIERCKLVQNIDDVVLCTSTNPQDAPLYEYALSHKIKFYAGSEDDVMERLLAAAKYYGFDAFVSITADNPLHSYYIANTMVDWYKKTPSDFIITSGLPIGIAPYFMRTEALEVAAEMKKYSDTEIWGPFVNRPDFFKIGHYTIESDLFDPDVRLTCDYLRDYQLFISLFNNFPQMYNPSIFEISKLFKDKIVDISNSKMVQSSLEPKLMEEINNTFDNNKEKGINYAKKYGISLNAGENHLHLKL
ncbi:NTP transferase domain-containing protein [uncultured Aquimarina sp.]|uniref:cytidylyltransferase domain-containing protein n=1 Tax=uncultured Aquimarina sp. TaxID=575652 RepID=UPI002605A239|nr:NTP transferase domain-containing protein [uncultured Aquimarina sp.]